ncbi:unnamed protein product [Polarella glacialis]|uniref:Uncharacterized protein n=1 Tax=Polarella glacialis TaxID=89957 RepID=A0A813H7E2_POLGL|nr:unnamed protein product [Polarella glacialis]
MSPPPEQILPNSDDSSSKDEISSGSESANSPLPATPEKRKSRWTKGGVAEEADDSTFSQDAPPPTSFTPPPGSDVVPRKILTPVHHFMAGSRRALWGDLANVTQPPASQYDLAAATWWPKGVGGTVTINYEKDSTTYEDLKATLIDSLNGFGLTGDKLYIDQFVDTDWAGDTYDQYDLVAATWWPKGVGDS